MTQAKSSQGISLLAKLLCAPNWKILPIPVDKRISKTRDFKLLHISSGNNTSLVVKKYMYLTNSISSWCSPQAWSLHPVCAAFWWGKEWKNQLFTWFFSRRNFPAWFAVQHHRVIVPEERIPGQVLPTEQQQHQSSTYSCSLFHHSRCACSPGCWKYYWNNITEIMWAKSRFPKPERAEEW